MPILPRGDTGTSMSDIELTLEGPVGVIALNRPAKRNAMTQAMQDALPGLVERVRQAGCRALVLTGTGADFCVGGDREIARRMDDEPGFEAEAVAFHRRSIAALVELGIPLIGGIEGAAIGFGAELVACCDMVVLGETARLSDPHVLFGRAPGPVTLLVWPQQTSRLVAAELLLTGREVGAQEALALGLANRVVPAGTARAAALEIAHSLAALPAYGVAQTKRALRLSMADLDPLYPQG